MTSSTGFMKSLLTTVKSCDPKNAETNARSAMMPRSFQFIFTFLRYWLVAIAVPLKAGILRVPITVETGRCGKKTKAKGVCINPPPPTIASINPAQNAAPQR